MKCPFCHEALTAVTNSRTTKSASQIWRRRRCINCEEVFTTHEAIDLSHLLVIKKSGKVERFSRMKLYSGIFYASQSAKIPSRELFIDKITQEIEKEILSLKKKQLQSSEVTDIVLKILRKRNTPTFLRFLTYCKNITNESQLKRELDKYLNS